MQARTWWIDKPLMMAASNPMGEDLTQLRAEGFNVVVSFLEERKQPPNYDKQLALAAGWALYSFPIEEGGTPSMAQLSEFIALVSALPEETRVLMHCESGLGRTACMAAAYWIARGLAANEAIGRVRQAASDEGWITPQRESALHEYARSQERSGAK
jgi:protein-tyrosine phosphatase